jgi:hypothetical protein
VWPSHFPKPFGILDQTFRQRKGIPMLASFRDLCRRAAEEKDPINLGGLVAAGLLNHARRNRGFEAV